jgi:FecR protein
MIPPVLLPTFSKRIAFGFALYTLAVTGARGVQPFTSATVTRLENQVTLGNHEGGNERPAVLHDVVEAQTYLFTQDKSRAELEFQDHSIVRVGQNTVFSFDAASRTLSLEKGAMLLYVPPGSGGGNIKTPSLTAAITGTVAKVSRDLIAVLSGELKTPWGTVHAGEAIALIKGKIVIFKFDQSQAMAGYLIGWGGPLPELPEIGGETNQIYAMPDLHLLDVLGINEVNQRFNSPFIKPSGPPSAPKPRTPQIGGRPQYP